MVKAVDMPIHPVSWLRRKVRWMLANSLPPATSRPARMPSDLQFVEEQLRNREARIDRLDAIVRARARQKAAR